MGKHQLLKEQSESEKLKNRNTPKKISLPYLEDNIKQEIFCRVPADLLHKNFKVLSKQWQKIISSPSFIDAQTLHPQHGFLQIVAVKDEGYQLWYLDLEGKGNNNTVRLLHKFPKTLFSVHPCNGLILCQYKDIFEILNPITKETITLPTPDFNYRHIDMIDFVYFPSTTNKYKVVKLYWGLGSESNYAFHIQTLKAINVSRGAWRRIDQTLSLFRPGNEHVLVNGIWYMPVRHHVNLKEKLLYFDVGDERTIRLLDYPCYSSTDGYSPLPFLVEMGGFLSAVSISCSGHFITYDFWILMDASNDEWVIKNKIERCILPRLPTMSNDADALKVVGSLNKGETVVFENYREGKIFVYNIRTRQWKRIVIPFDEKVRWHLTKSCHLNSLVSPDSLV